MKLNKADYIKILQFYDIPHSMLNKKQIQEKAHNMLATKLCRCIKKVNNKIKDKSKSIGICKKSIFTRKKLKSNKFKCKYKPRLIAKANSKQKLYKIKTLRKLKTAKKRR